MIETGKVVQFMICRQVDGRPVGSVYLRDIDREHGKAEYGIFIGEDDAIGRWIGSEACRLACDYGFAACVQRKAICSAALFVREMAMLL